jgi:hypothetical protein
VHGVAAVHESAFGTNRTCQPARLMSAYRGAADARDVGRELSQDGNASETSLALFPHHTATFMLRRPPLGSKDFDVKPEHEVRRKLIREWMSLPKDKRQTEEQAKPFAKKAMERLPSGGDPYRQIMSWLLPRIGKP